MTLERLLQLNMALLALLAAFMLGLGQESMLLPAAMAVVAVAALVLTDFVNVFRLNRLVANFAMLLAAFVALNDFFKSDSHEQLLSIGNLLIYVQMILLLQKKSFRIYGQIAVFSLLQVVVASLLNDGLEFGLLLVSYMIVGLFALSLFFLHRETERTTDIPGQSLDPTVVVLGTESPQSLGLQLLRGGLLSQVTGFCVATLMLAGVFFYFTPRLGDSSWKYGGLGRNTLVGFSPEISFDEMGQILQNSALVMRVSFRNHLTDEPYVVIGEPYFRGAVLTRYVIEGGKPRWKQSLFGARNRGDRLADPKPARELVRQEIALEPVAGNILFAVYPTYAISSTPNDIRFHRTHRQLFRIRRDEDARQYRYALVTSGFRFGTQIPLVPHTNLNETDYDRRNLQFENTQLTYIYLEGLRRSDEPSMFPELTRLAQEAIAENAKDQSNYARAKALESWFLDRGRFSYTLDGDTIRRQRREGVDPVEDFVANHRMGHCEYFASALCLMLRTQGIPARVVVGYKGGEYNFVGSYFQVRQSNAHAWVEAYVPREEIPENTLDPVEIHDGGAWLRLDPTPARDEDDAANQRTVVDRMTESFDYARWLWSDYVLRLTSDQQRLSMVRPFNTGDQSKLNDLLDLEKWKREAEEVLAGKRVSSRWRWTGVPLTVLMIAMAVWIAYRYFPGLFRWFSRGKLPRRRSGSPVSRVAFYRRLERVLARYGLRRRKSQTPREFAQVSAERLAEWLPASDAAKAPPLVVEAFYAERFGLSPSSSEQLAVIDAALAELERGYPQWKKARKKSVQPAG